ncbi:TTLL2 [Symbiodinium natans]|uniref:TTLL2 protein n=1 Tax=Symbiodinium natans TaxID=878477 RepID=A0A812SFZ2_9DINO|nr:TTLL2 [Symbiodinium natans]
MQAGLARPVAAGLGSVRHQHGLQRAAVDVAAQERARSSLTPRFGHCLVLVGSMFKFSEVLCRRKGAKCSSLEEMRRSRLHGCFAGRSRSQMLQQRRRPTTKGEAQSGATTVKDDWTTMRKVRRLLKAGTSVVLILLLLLYITSFVEGAMHKLFAHPMTAKSPAVALIIGLAVGGLHTVAGPDHLAALAPLVIGKGRSVFAAFGLGALWGSGHATGQLIIGIGCLAVKMGLLQMHVAQVLEQTSGLLVGASLIAIGLLGFKEARDYDAEDEAISFDQNYGWATYATGVVHGLSLDAIIFILPAFSLPRFSAVVHVLGVVFGTLFSMGCYTTVLSLFFRKSPKLKLISSSASSISLLLGICILMSCVGIDLPLPGL